MEIFLTLVVSLAMALIRLKLTSIVRSRIIQGTIGKRIRLIINTTPNMGHKNKHKLIIKI